MKSFINGSVISDDISTSETFTGKYIVISGTRYKIYSIAIKLINTLASGENKTLTSLTNLKLLLNTEIIFNYNGNMYQHWSALSDYHIDSSGYLIFSNSQASLSVTECYAILEYIKTTN